MASATKKRMDFRLIFVVLMFFSIGLALLYYQKIQKPFLSWGKFKTDLSSGISMMSLSEYLKTDVNVTADDSDADFQENEEWKTVLYWTTWFTDKWSSRFGPDNATALRKEGCPSWRCHFTYNRSFYDVADAVLFLSLAFTPNKLPSYRPTPKQRWVWADVECPFTDQAKNAHTYLIVANTSHLINWTMTYHRKADVMGAYGYFIPINDSRPLQPNLMSSHESTMARYLDDYKGGLTLEDVMGPSWKAFVRRPKPVAWMASHCGTYSEREDYINELDKYIPVDKYGGCGTLSCSKKNKGNWCWETVLSKNYSFYLSMENNFCDEYITEKLYKPLHYNVVPIVWGGSDYSQFLPKGSYINAQLYHPKELASLITRLMKDPVAYGRYHVWRRYFAVVIKGSLCELCHRLHTDYEEKSYTNIPKWRSTINKCFRAPQKMFNNSADPTVWKKLIYSDFKG